MTARRKPSTFAERLKALRERAGLSVADLALKAGLSRQVLYRYESGERDSGWSVVQRLADALDVATDELRDSS